MSGNLKPPPSTPAAVAAAVLDAIEARPQNFSMHSWHWQANGDASLLPSEEPGCGTTMCVAGWAAHVTGWTLRGSRGFKDGDARDVEDIAQDALGLEYANLFYYSAEDAVEALRGIAGR
ncbi:hypothetical protein ACIQPQ_34540 [Streptomyces sp. NPDC091281]|uniref:hypothetical protein n=1 Tax=Streptomyces sp. NPDC091281 TaxID=3365985 RepID=UPI00381063F2